MELHSKLDLEMKIYRKLELEFGIVDLFEDIGIFTNIHEPNNFACCNNCVHSEIEDVFKEYYGDDEVFEENFDGYVAIHTQEMIRIINQINSGANKLEFLLCWSPIGETSVDDMMTKIRNMKLYDDMTIECDSADKKIKMTIPNFLQRYV